jgi:hypothetical protein
MSNDDIPPEQNPHIRSEMALLGVAAVLYLLYLAYFTLGLHFNMFTTDVQTYWNDSLKWTTPFSTWWVPGYPLMIAAVRGITFNALGPIVIMAGISAVAYLVAVSAVYRLAVHNAFNHPFAAGLAFAAFPFVGLTYAVFPIADITAIALLLLTVLSLVKRQWVWFVIFSGACMMVHKVMWFFAPPLMLVAFVKHKESRMLLPLSLLPLLIWMAAGAIYHRDAIWFVRWSYDNLFVAKGTLPVLDGVITPLLSNSPEKIAKGILVAVVMALAAIAAVYGFRHKHWVGMCTALSLLAMAVFVNSFEIWAVVRFSKLLVIPLSFAGTGFIDSRPKTRVRLAAALALLVFVASNLAFGFYLARMYRAG